MTTTDEPCRVIGTRREYGYIVVETTPVRLMDGPTPVEITAWASAPEYGAGRVLGSGFRVRKDGTCGNQRAKPVFNYGGVPAVVRAAFASEGYDGQGAL